VRAFAADAPPTKRIDEVWTETSGRSLLRPFPERSREQSSSALLVGTSETALGVRRTLLDANLGAVAGSFRPTGEPGNYCRV
jgi:hypothetical protein